MSIADQFLRASRRFGLGDISKKQMATNLVSATEVSNPNVADINVRGAPGIPSIRDAEVFARRDAKARVTQRFKSAGVPEGISIGLKGYDRFGKKLGRALNETSASDTNPFAINPADTTSSAYAFKEGGFVNKK